ncbi:WhiB family transcriptional regulator [Streptomyces lydicus]|uniref:WhiB family transcriptional regulator n=1 Tax=Streptomyces lydicus TaxID=47763 RepID=UPI00371F11E3
MSAYAWMDEALCAQTDPDAFHADGSGHGYRAAASICGACPVRKECEAFADRLEGTLSHRDRHGMWGGRVPRRRSARAAATAKQQRDALILRLAARGGMSPEEIAATAGCEVRTVHRVTAAHRDSHGTAA